MSDAGVSCPATSASGLAQRGFTVRFKEDVTLSASVAVRTTTNATTGRDGKDDERTLNIADSGELKAANLHQPLLVDKTVCGSQVQVHNFFRVRQTELSGNVPFSAR